MFQKKTIAKQVYKQVYKKLCGILPLDEHDQSKFHNSTKLLVLIVKNNILEEYHLNNCRESGVSIYLESYFSTSVLCQAFWPDLFSPAFSLDLFSLEFLLDLSSDFPEFSRNSCVVVGPEYGSSFRNVLGF